MVHQATEQNLSREHLFLNANQEEPVSFSFGEGAISLFSARCPGRMRSNEDAVAVIPVGDGSAVLALADGVGGLPDGEHASAMALKRLRATVLKDTSEGMDRRSAILDGFEAANRAAQGLEGGATTLAVVELHARQVRPYHAGDSMILVVGQRGRLKLQTVPHSPVGYAVESGMLDESEAMVHEDRHLISNAIGSADMRIEVGSSLPMAPRDTLVLASDGLWDNLFVEEIVERIRKGPLPKAAAALAYLALRRMTDPQPGLPSKPDDLSFILYRPTA